MFQRINQGILFIRSTEQEPSIYLTQMPKLVQTTTADRSDYIFSITFIHIIDA